MCVTILAKRAKFVWFLAAVDFFDGAVDKRGFFAGGRLLFSTTGTAAAFDKNASLCLNSSLDIS
jgi:hypothetical protein